MYHIDVNLCDDSSERGYYGFLFDTIDDTAVNESCQSGSICDSLCNFLNHFLVTLSIRRRHVVADMYVATLESSIKLGQFIDDFLV